MRNEEQMLKIILQVAKSDDRIRCVTLEGSRTNKNIVPDAFQDYDVSYFVTDLASFKKADDWLDVFGKRIFMQKPEDMELFPPELGNWFSYLILFEDGNRLDLTLIPVEETNMYVEKSDGLVKVLLDKDGGIRENMIPTDRNYWIEKPTAKSYDDCCNEFWWVSTYVVKGLARGEILYANDHLHEIVRPNLLRMMSWHIGIEEGFNFSLGKNYKSIKKYLPREDWDQLLSTFSQDDYSKVWKSLFSCYQLFRKYSQSVGRSLGFPYPDYDKVITKYTANIYRQIDA